MLLLHLQNDNNFFPKAFWTHSWHTSGPAKWQMPLKKWVANIASQYCQPILPFRKLWSCWMPTSGQYHRQTGKHLKQARENQSTHHTFPKQHKTPPLEIINPESANDITANFHKENEPSSILTQTKPFCTHEMTKSRLSVVLLALDTTLCGRPESPFVICHVYDHFISRTNITHELLPWKQGKKKVGFTFCGRNGYQGCEIRRIMGSWLRVFERSCTISNSFWVEEIRLDCWWHHRRCSKCATSLKVTQEVHYVLGINLVRHSSY